MKILHRAIDDTNDIRFNYFIGKIGIENDIKLKESIETLLKYINSANDDDLWGSIKDESYYQLGTGYLKLKNRAKAKASFYKSLEYNPNNEKAKKALEDL